MRPSPVPAGKTAGCGRRKPKQSVRELRHQAGSGECTFNPGESYAYVFEAYGLCAAPAAQAADQPQEWELINPTGEIEKVAVEPAKRITALEGKTIALRWNGKNNGDLVLDRLAELLAKKYPTAKVVKTYRDMADQNLNKISATQDESMRIVKAVASVRPDIVIASQAD